MKKILFIALFIALGFGCQITLADPPDATEVDEIQLRDPLELERAVMEYMCSFEAYIAARKSKDPAVRSKLVKLMQAYRNSYARFLELLREDKLYRPNKPKDPAGWYDEKHKKDKGYKRDWKKTDGKEIRAEVKEMVKNGASPEEIRAFIKAKLPSAPMSTDPGVYTTTTTTTTTTTSPKTIPPPTKTTVPPPLPPKPPLDSDDSDKDGDKDSDKDN